MSIRVAKVPGAKRRLVEARTLAEHGLERVEALHLNRAAAPELPPQLELLQ